MKQLILSDDFAEYLTALVAMQPEISEEDYEMYEKLKDINPDYLSEAGKEFIAWAEETKFNGTLLTFTDYEDKDEPPFWIHEVFKNIDNLFCQGKITHVKVIKDCDQGNEGEILKISDYDDEDMEFTFKVEVGDTKYSEWINNGDIIPVINK